MRKNSFPYVFPYIRLFSIILSVFSLGIFAIYGLVFASTDVPAPQNLSINISDEGRVLMPASCSNPGFATEEECVLDRSSCSDPAYINQSECEAAAIGSCSDNTSTDQATCESNVNDPGGCTDGNSPDQLTCESTIQSGGCTDGVSLDQSSCESNLASSASCSDTQYGDQSTCEASIASPGYCSDNSTPDQSTCESIESGGTCTDGSSGDQMTCQSSISNQYCDNADYNNQEDCEANSATWVTEYHSWNPSYHTWTPDTYNTWTPDTYHVWNGNPVYFVWNETSYHSWDPTGGGYHTWTSEPGSEWFPEYYANNGAYVSDGATRYYRVYSVIDPGILSSTYAQGQVTDTTSDTSYNVNLDWDPVSGATDYVVVESVNAGVSYTRYWETGEADSFSINSGNYSDYGILANDYEIFDPPARTLYYNNSGLDGDWNNSNNWYIDAGFTQRDGNIPENGDTVYIEGDVTVPPSQAVGLEYLYISQNTDDNTVDLGENVVTVSNGLSVGDDSNYGSLYGSITVGTASFYEGSVNYGTINGNTSFRGNSYNDAAGVVNGNATFYNDNSSNFGTVTGSLIRHYLSTHTPNRDFTGWDEIVSQGDLVEVDLSNSTNYAGITLTEVNGGIFVNVDTTVPSSTSIPDLVSGSDTGFSLSDDITSDTTPIFSMSCESNAIVSLKEESTTLGTGTCSSGTILITSSALSDGVHTITAIQTDAAGNISATSEGLEITIDDTSPTVELTSPSDDATISGSSVSVTADASDGVGVRGVQFKIGTTNIGSEDLSSPFGTTLDASEYSNGSYTIYAIARDTAGNLATTSIDVTVNNLGGAPGDTTPPTLEEVTPVETPTTDTTPSYIFNSSEAGTITYGGSCSSDSSGAILGSNTIVFNELEVGTYSNCTITVTDSHSNASNPLSVSEFTIIAEEGGGGEGDGEGNSEEEPAPDEEDENNPSGGSNKNKNDNNERVVFSQKFEVGETGTEVEELQKVLIEKGYIAKDEIKELGNFDDKTEKAYIEYLTETEEDIVRKDLKGSEVFTEELKLNDQGEEVKKLQKFLNKFLFFVSTDGAGSPGEETDYFGIKTMNALIKLQLYLGLPPTGILSSITRELISK